MASDPVAAAEDVHGCAGFPGEVGQDLGFIGAIGEDEEGVDLDLVGDAFAGGFGGQAAGIGGAERRRGLTRAAKLGLTIAKGVPDVALDQAGTDDGC